MEFMLDPGVTFLNHGSFGACPKVVHEEYQRIQRHLESQPVRFMQMELPTLLADARASLANFVGVCDRDVVFVTNPTFAVNELARSLKLDPTDEVLISDQEYGACHNAWRFMARRDGYSIVEQPIPLPVRSDDEIVEQFWSGVTRNTRVILLSHITSPTALTMPVAEICRRAKEQQILTIVDGAHAPGQIDLDIESIGADFYTGTCHKWLCAPKGASFLYAHKSVQHLIEPLVVGWGWGTNERKFDSGSNFLDYHEWLGTDDPSAYLTVPKAIDFQHQNDWPSVRKQCHNLAIQLIDRASELPHVARVHDNRFFQQMALIELTQGGDETKIKSQLYDRNIEVPVITWKERVFLRVSIQAYNTVNDVDRLVEAVRVLTS